MKDKFKDKINDRSYEERLRNNYKQKMEKSEERANSYSVFLAVVCAVVAILFFVYRAFWIGLGFIGLGGLLLLMVYLSKRAENKNNKK